MKTLEKNVITWTHLAKVLLVCTLLVSCSKDDSISDINDPQYSVEEANAFNSAVAKLGGFDQPAESSFTETNSSDPERDVDDTTLECVTKTYNGAMGFNEMFTLDPTTDVIYPGALLHGESITTGEYIGINAQRTPITISTSLSNISGTPSIVVNDPNKLSEVRAGINTLLSQEVNGATPAQISLDITEVYSEEHMAVAIGANYRDITKKVSANIDFSRTTKKNTFVIKFIQRYFTLDLDSPGTKPSDLFTNLPDMSTLGSVNPVYVSSVTYGRMVLYTVESESSITDVKAAFDASAASTDGTIDATYQNIINSSNIQAMIIGGSGNGAVQAIYGPMEVYNFISEGGNYSKDSPGAPLAYKLRFVKEGFPVAKVVLASEYHIRDCDLAYPEYQVVIKKIKRDGGLVNIDIYGHLVMKMKIGNEYLDANNNGMDDGPYWDISPGNDINLSPNSQYPIEKSYTFKPYKPNMAVDYIHCYGNLYKKNVIGYDNLIYQSDAIQLDELQLNQEKESVLSFDNNVYAFFKIVRIK